MSRSSSRPLLALVVAMAALGGLPQPVLGHADLVGATPAPNSSVAVAPERLVLTFSEPVDATTAFVEVVDAQDSPVDLGGLSIADGGTATADLPELAPGIYTVSYRVASTVDGHVTEGEYAFLVDPTGAAPPPADTARESSPSVNALSVMARWIALAGLLVALGGLVIWASSGRAALAGLPEHERRPPWVLVGVAATLGGVGTLAYLLLTARPMAGAAPGMLLDIGAAFGWTPFAIAMRVTLIAALGAGVVATLAERGRWTGGGFPIAAGALLVFALAGSSVAGHAAAIGGPAFAAIDLLHLLAVAAWLGALPAAVALARRAGAQSWRTLGDVLRRHGRLALVAAPIVVVTGLANSPLVLGRSRDLVASDYGNLLLAKALLVSVALGIGAVNHLALRGRRRSTTVGLIGAELAVAVLAVLTAATMVTIQPASARRDTLTTSAVRPAHFFDEVGGFRVHLAVSLPAPGRQAYRVTIRDGSGGLPDDLEAVELAFTPPAGTDLAPERVPLDVDPATAVWAAAGTHTPVAGTWGVEIVVDRAEGPDGRLAYDLLVADPGPVESVPSPDTGIGLPAPIALAWGLLPSGAVGWLPAFLAGAVVLGLGLLRPSRARAVARGLMGAVLVLAVATPGTRDLVGLASAPSADDLERAPPITAGSAEAGAAVYLANCASCHGADGSGHGTIAILPVPRPLGDVISGATGTELSYRISTGVAGTPMPAFAGLLTPDERSDLIAFLRERWGDQ